MKDNKKRNDMILIGVIFVAALLFYLIFTQYTKKPGAQILITMDGVEYETAPLNKDTQITIEGLDGHLNILEIKDGYAKMIEASCPDKYCMHQSKISMQNETIVCLPNKVVVEVINGEVSEMDGIVQ